MTLGRSSTGAIKIKTDAPKGLRAVECACCGGQCGNCPSFKQLLGVSSVSISGTMSTHSASGSDLLLDDPFTQFEEYDWNNGYVRSAGSSLCGVSAAKSSLYILENIQFSVAVAPQCKLIGYASYYAAPGANYTAAAGGSQIVEASSLPVTFNFNVVGEGVIQPWPDEENPNPPPIILPINWPCTITLS